MRVTARLITACGASRDIQLDHMPRAYKVPMMPTARIRRGESLADYALPSMQVRTFVLDRHFGYQDGWIAEYHEELVI